MKEKEFIIMAWHQIKGHEKLKKILQKSILTNRVAHSYCFFGIKGIGKEAMAIEFAKTLNCDSPIKTNDSVEACEVCTSCQQFKKFQHPNLILIFSLPAGKSSDAKSDSPLAKLSDEQLKEIQEQLLLKSDDYYYKIRIPNANQIKIASIREIRRKLTYSNPRKGRRVVIIINAHEMTEEAANAFLKTLEEPHENITIILTTSNKELIPQTILSRCQHIKFNQLSNEEIKEFLTERYKLEPENAEFISLFSQGSVTNAQNYLDEDIRQIRYDAIDLLRTSLKKNIFRVELLEHIEELTKSKDKKLVESYLNLLIYWLRDANELSKLGARSRIINFDQKDVIEKFVVRFKSKDIQLLIYEVEKAQSLLKRNVNPQLILITLLLYIRKKLLEISN